MKHRALAVMWLAVVATGCVRENPWFGRVHTGDYLPPPMIDDHAIEAPIPLRLVQWDDLAVDIPSQWSDAPAEQAAGVTCWIAPREATTFPRTERISVARALPARTLREAALGARKRARDAGLSIERPWAGARVAAEKREREATMLFADEPLDGLTRVWLERIVARGEGRFDAVSCEFTTLQPTESLDQGEPAEECRRIVTRFGSDERPDAFVALTSR